jgi:hypothetical protein
MIKPGDKLANGATALVFMKRGDKRLVLADFGGHHRFVTWRLDDNNNTFLGHYFSSVEEALKDLEVR